ncbi:uncharacterized protein LOC141821962 [Curcuma longa]|uniref:uncharacterized protein LOC141821962 n=1 Tax=Curcuma longa TaxID=136217 RepID=UPI003D9DE699
MAQLCRMKMKRKDLEEACDEFMEFSLSSPARKIRRLDPDEFSPIMEEVETASAMACDGSVSGVSDNFLPSSESLHKEGSPPYPSNDERAIVLYKPVESPIFLSPGSSNPSLRVTSDLIHALKNHVSKPGDQRLHAKDETEANSSSLALVPWEEPSEASMVISGETAEAEEAEATSMEVEVSQVAGYGAGGEGLRQLPQHCKISQFLPKASFDPIMWSWVRKEKRCREIV